MKPNLHNKNSNEWESTSSEQGQSNTCSSKAGDAKSQVESLFESLTLSNAAVDALIMNAMDQRHHTGAELESICVWAQNTAIGYYMLQSALKGRAGIKIGADGNPEIDYCAQKPALYSRIREKHPHYPDFQQSDWIYLDPTLILTSPHKKDQGQS